MDLLLMHDFIIPHLGHVENIGSLRYTDLPNAETFHSSLFKKNHICYYRHQSHQKNLKVLGSRPAHNGGYVSQNSIFCLKTWISLLAINSVKYTSPFLCEHHFLFQGDWGNDSFHCLLSSCCWLDILPRNLHMLSCYYIHFHYIFARYCFSHF